MTFFKQNSARHRAESTSHAVRNTTIAAAAGAAMIGSIAPAQAYAQAPVSSSWSAPAALTSYSAPTYQAPVTAPQPAVSTAADEAPAALQPAASSLAPQSTATGGLVGTAMQGVGSGYVFGGTAYGAWDCSGFTQWVFAQHGIDLPRTTWAQFAAATPVSEPRPGDLVSQNGGGHVGIYLGGGKMISALNPAQGTQVHSIHAMPLAGFYRI